MSPAMAIDRAPRRALPYRPPVRQSVAPREPSRDSNSAEEALQEIFDAAADLIETLAEGK